MNKCKDCTYFKSWERMEQGGLEVMFDNFLSIFTGRKKEISLQDKARSQQC